jgi:hypothetical protein
MFTCAIQVVWAAADIVRHSAASSKQGLFIVYFNLGDAFYLIRALVPFMKIF